MAPLAHDEHIANLEVIEVGGAAYAYVVRAEAAAAHTQFVTPDHLNMQLGFVVYPAGGAVAPHRHLPLERRIVGTTEVLLVREGRCELDIFDVDQKRVATVELRRGDIAFLVTGGHGLRMLEDTVLLEVKQGPYTGMGEKERF